jgi:hypothetical protein
MRTRGAEDREGPEAAADNIALGFRVKSGVAIAVVLAGDRAAPTPLTRHIVELSDPRAAETRQPYHDGFGTAQQDERELARRIAIVERCAKASISALLSELRPCKAVGAALVVGSVIDPASVGNPHIRAHANEGRLFRTVVEDALKLHGIQCEVIVEKQLAARAAARLRCRPADLTRTLAAFGKTIGGQWRADDKAAATAAWLALTRAKA